MTRLSSAARHRANAFFETASEFHLGELPTERSHPKTRHLSELARTDLANAISLFTEVERDAYEAIRCRLPEIHRLRDEIKDVFSNGQRVFLCGCGATGRLSLTIEFLWRSSFPPDAAKREWVFSFMAGGDYALVRSIENFEDHPDYGARQLEEAGFRKGDLLIACTEGGETPFVIGAAFKAAEFGGRPPYFLYCNPDEVLLRVTERSRRVLSHSGIRKLNLTVGPMAITGSTRLQASSVLMFAAGSALLSAGGLASSPKDQYARLTQWLSTANLRAFIPLIERESAIYENNEFCLHSSRAHAISVFTDLTERSPTFSVPAFESSFPSSRTTPCANLGANSRAHSAAWTYLEVSGASTPSQAWNMILARDPRALEWTDFNAAYGQQALLGFDFSEGVEQRRSLRIGNHPQHRYLIFPEDQDLVFKLDQHEARITRDRNLLIEHLTLKLVLNLCSTLVMARLGRYEGNVMLWVRASNNKLIDRGIRYIHELLLAEGLTPPPYSEIAIELFDVLDSLQADESAVLITRDRLRPVLAQTGNI